MITLLQTVSSTMTSFSHFKRNSLIYNKRHLLHALISLPASSHKAHSNYCCFFVFLLLSLCWTFQLSKTSHPLQGGVVHTPFTRKTPLSRLDSKNLQREMMFLVYFPAFPVTRPSGRQVGAVFRHLWLPDKSKSTYHYAAIAMCLIPCQKRTDYGFCGLRATLEISLCSTEMY